MPPPPTFPAKFSSSEEAEDRSFDYDDRYFIQETDGVKRLVIGLQKDHVEVMLRLARELKGEPWFVLYVLLNSRLENHDEARYQSEPFDSYESLKAFMEEFTGFFENDGRHHVWIGSAQNDGHIVYDQHNVLFCYGPLETFTKILDRWGFEPGEFWFPFPHRHAYQPENDEEESRLLDSMRWEQFPLQAGDRWNEKKE